MIFDTAARGGRPTTKHRHTWRDNPSYLDDADGVSSNAPHVKAESEDPIGNVVVLSGHRTTLVISHDPEPVGSRVKYDKWHEGY